MILDGGIFGQRPQRMQRARSHAAHSSSTVSSAMARPRPATSFMAPSTRRRHFFRFTDRAYPACRIISVKARSHATPSRRDLTTCLGDPRAPRNRTTLPSPSYSSATCSSAARNRTRFLGGRLLMNASAKPPITISSAVGSGRASAGSTGLIMYAPSTNSPRGRLGRADQPIVHVSSSDSGGMSHCALNGRQPWRPGVIQQSSDLHPRDPSCAVRYGSLNTVGLMGPCALRPRAARVRPGKLGQVRQAGELFGGGGGFSAPLRRPCGQRRPGKGGMLIGASFQSPRRFFVHPTPNPTAAGYGSMRDGSQYQRAIYARHLPLPAIHRGHLHD